jgi:hypothetical protein
MSREASSQMQMLDKSKRLRLADKCNLITNDRILKAMYDPNIPTKKFSRETGASV